MENLVLIGFMGCGKSTVGVRLAQALQQTFLDTDSYIEDRQNTDITRLFAEKGEDFFRDLETACLKELLGEKQERVIATGGGIVIRPENRVLLKQLGTVIFLKVSPQTVYERLMHDRTRPLLQGENPLAKIEKLLEDRSGYYEEAAQFVIEADNKSVQELTEEIKEMIEKRGWRHESIGD